MPLILYCLLLFCIAHSYFLFAGILPIVIVLLYIVVFHHPLLFFIHRCYLLFPPCHLFIIVRTKTYTTCHFLENNESIKKQGPLFCIARYYLLLPVIICCCPCVVFIRRDITQCYLFINRCYLLFIVVIFYSPLLFVIIVHTKTETIFYVLETWKYNTK